MPKSSMARWTPSARMSCRVSSAADASAMMLVSVISNQSASGSSPVSASTRATIRTNDGSPNWAAETLTARCRPVPGDSACQRASCAQALASTAAPSGTISPDSSATSMNSAGGSSPRSGCCQRTSASKPSSARVPASTIGW